MPKIKIKNPERTKNIVIIALAVLVLAAVIIKLSLSNSGSVVEAEYIAPGSLSTEIRGSGVVASNATVDVLCEKSCVIHSISVQEGDEIKAGDVLAEFSDYADAEVEALRTELDALILEYQMALVDKSGEQYAKERTAIDQAKRALEKAKADCEKNLVSDAEITAAKDKINQCQIAVADKEGEIAALQAMGAGEGVSLEKAQEELKALMLNHQSNYDILISKADEWMREDGLTGKELENQRSTYLAAVVGRDRIKITDLQVELTNVSINNNYSEQNRIQKEIDYLQSLIKTYEAVKPAMDKVAAAESADVLLKAQTELIGLNRETTNAEAALAELNSKREAWKAANDTLNARRQAVDSAVEALEAAQDDAQKSDLELNAKKEAIDKKRAEVTALVGGEDGEAVPVALYSKVNGLVTSVSVVAGSSAEAGAVLMTVEVPDLGYTVSFPVSREQSALLSPGDAGEVTFGYEPAEIGAVLKEIAPYPENPAQKLLVFELEGQADTGAELNISVGKPQEEFSAVIPRSALREDSAGSYIMRVAPKRGLFGTSYVLERVSVSVQAQDDKSAAVSGELSTGDMAVTSQPLTLKNGDRVRLES